VLIDGRNLSEVSHLPLAQSKAFFDGLTLVGQRAQVADKIVSEISSRLQFLINVGLDYLSLDRSADTLSGGESQRIRLASQIGSGLTGVMYVLDEPSIGLHQRDNDRLLETLRRLRDMGNTVLVVEHDEDAIRMADYVVDMGPGAGEHGGHVIAQGTPGRRRRPPGFAHRRLSLRRPLHRRARPAPCRQPGKNRCASKAPAATTSRTSASKFRSGCSPASPASPARANHPDQRHPLRPRGPPRERQQHRGRALHSRIDGLDHSTRSSTSTRAPSAAPRAPTRPPTPACFTPIRDLFSGVPEAKRPRLRPRPLQLQRQGRALRSLPGRRPDQGRDALPARHLRALRHLPRQALQPRNPGDPLQGQNIYRSARHDRRAGPRLLLAPCPSSPASCTP
jgi:excinuclease ABC subunit A